MSGVLVCFPEQTTALCPPDAVLLTIEAPRRTLHLRANVRRIERGSDHQVYVGAEYLDVDDHQAGSLRALVDAPG